MRRHRERHRVTYNRYSRGAFIVLEITLIVLASCVKNDKKI